jgi:hypothetical protein
VWFASVDYAGLADAFLGHPLGTRVDGAVMERPLANGQAEVRVMLFSDRANTWVVDLDVQGSRRPACRPRQARPTNTAILRRPRMPPNSSSCAPPGVEGNSASSSCSDWGVRPLQGARLFSCSPPSSQSSSTDSTDDSTCGPSCDGSCASRRSLSSNQGLHS